MSPGPSVSILTATHNSLQGLKETVRSVDAQTTDDYEHVVIDGGSTDGTRNWLEQVDLPIRWLSEPDEGIADALNKGIKLAIGEWILVLQAEDTFENASSLSHAIEALDTNADIITYDVRFLTDRGSRIFRTRGLSPKINFKTTIPHQGALTRTELFERIGHFDPSLRFEMDYEFFLRSYRAGARSISPGGVLSCMPDTGITSRLDWPSLQSRFAEERVIHERHAQGSAMRFVYALYWQLYPRYRRVRALLT